MFLPTIIFFLTVRVQFEQIDKCIHRGAVNEINDIGLGFKLYASVGFSLVNY